MKALKKVPSDAKGLSKLPSEVRNKMGYMKEGGKVKGDPPKKNKLVKKAGKDAYNKTKKQGLRPGTVSYESNEIASSRAKTQAQKNASEAYDNIMNFVGDRKYEDGGKVKKKGKKPNYKKTETFADYKSAAATFQDFDPGKDTVFVGASIDPGVADKKAQRQGNISASKGASSSSYNDTKMYRTKNEAGQDVYVSLRKYDKYKKGGKVFKPHNMYKDGKKVVAKTMADHLRLKKKGYSHKKG